MRRRDVLIGQLCVDKDHMVSDSRPGSEGRVFDSLKKTFFTPLIFLGLGPRLIQGYERQC